MKVIFCSCSKLQSFAPQRVWGNIKDEQPDALLLLGDNVYLDHDHHVDASELSKELKQLYANQLAEPNFRALLADLESRGALLLSIYDDHDFLGDNRYGGDNDPALRETARREFVSALSPAQTGNEVYSTIVRGNVRIIILDVRFYRESATASYNHRNAILGEAQWTWLEALLASSDSTFNVIASSSNFHRFADESWEQYPAAFDRLRALLQHRSGTLFISGDTHNNDSYDESGVIELVSSGVSRKGVVFGGIRENYGVLTFDSTGVNVHFNGLKIRDRMQFRIDLAAWHL